MEEDLPSGFGTLASVSRAHDRSTAGVSVLSRRHIRSLQRHPTRVAIMYTLIETAKPNCEAPEAWLADVCPIADHPINRVGRAAPLEMESAVPKPSRHLRKLDQELLALGEDAMLLEELDGFIAGLLVCPDLIKPGEWLPLVWGSENGDEPAFSSLDHLNRVLGLVMDHYNDVARTLIERPDRYGPLFAVDKRNNDILWELWVTGFEKAVKLRPAAWQRLLIADRETALAMSGLLTLADVDRRDARFSTEQLEALSAAAPDKIGPWVVALNRWRLANHTPASNLNTPPSPFSAPPTNVGRTDPCPCGSGKKYKKCCGLN
jgi:uncharacterized protein